MAGRKSEVTVFSLADPTWSDPLPDPGDLRLIYGVEADELVVLIDGTQHSPAYLAFIGTADEVYAAIKVDMHSGAVIGVLVYPLAALGVERHPEWRAAMAPNPRSSVAKRIMMDIKQLYDRYGLIPDTTGLG